MKTNANRHPPAVRPLTAAASGWIRTDTQNGRPSATGTLACLAGHRLASAGVDDGIFAGWIWDGRALRIEHDRYGMFPLFRWDTDDSSTFATDLLQLVTLGAPIDLDVDALSVFLRIGFFLGDDTPLRSIRAVLPSRPRTRPARLTRAAAIDGYIELLRQAVRRRLPDGPFVLPLSGGRDSRHILFELMDAGCPPSRCVTVRHFPPRDNQDEAIARALCERLALPHAVLDQPDDRIGVERRKNVRTHLCTEEHAQFVVLADYLAGATRDTFDGIAGDVLSQSGYSDAALLALFRRGDVRGVAEHLLNGHGNVVTERALARLVTPRLHAALSRDRAVARLEREIATHLDAVNPIASFYFWNRTRREIALAPFGLQRDIRTFAPYLDRDVFDFLSALPPELTIDRTLHTEAIATAFPAHADIPYEQRIGGSPEPRSQGALARRLLAVVATGKGRQMLNRRGLLPSIGWTAMAGSSRRLWNVPFVIWLDQLGSIAAASGDREE